MLIFRLLLLSVLLSPVARPATLLAQEGTAPEAAMQEKARPYIEFADQIVAALSAGQVGAFQASLSPTLVKSMSPEELNGFVDNEVAPFFASYGAAGEEQTIAPIRHPKGMPGFAFFRSFTTKNGQERPFALYILEEDGRLVVGNIVLGRRFEDVRPQQ